MGAFKMYLVNPCVQRGSREENVHSVITMNTSDIEVK